MLPGLCGCRRLISVYGNKKMSEKEVLEGPPSHVLLVGDETELKPLVAAVQHQGLRLSLSAEGQLGYERALAAQPDVIISQQNMAGMDGLNLLRLLTTNPLTREIPVLLLVDAQAGAAQRLEGFREGAADVVASPFLPDEVLAKVMVHLHWLARVRRAQEGADPDPAPTGQEALTEQEVLVRAVQKLVRGNLSEPPSVAQLAQRFAVSERRLAAAFKACLDMSVFAYTRQERMRKAQHLLAHTALSMEAIAAEIGFSSAANFSTAFHAYCSTTPTAYRSAAHEQAWKARETGLVDA